MRQGRLESGTAEQKKSTARLGGERDSVPVLQALTIAGAQAVTEGNPNRQSYNHSRTLMAE